MKSQILKLIASSKNSYELADRICELWEKREDEYDIEMDQALRERDYAEEWADKLAYTIGSDLVIGEHSNTNNPWENACRILESGSTPASPEDSRRDVGKGK